MGIRHGIVRGDGQRADPREFRQFVVLGPDGSVIATKLVADGAPPPVDTETETHADVTELYGITDVSGLKIDFTKTDRRDAKAIRQALKQARAAHGGQ